jgi:hypothetical protein
MEGRYWTDRDSRGELLFVHRSKKLADDYSGAQELFSEERPSRFKQLFKSRKG